MLFDIPPLHVSYLSHRIYTTSFFTHKYIRNKPLMTQSLPSIFEGTQESLCH